MSYQLLAPRGLETRPLPDRIKQALFDWLGQRMDGLVVVDCCAGSGAFAFEALSRGARRVEAIEPGAHAVPVLRANAAKLGNPPNLVLHARPFRRCCRGSTASTSSSPTLPSHGTRTTPGRSPSCCASAQAASRPPPAS